MRLLRLLRNTDEIERLRHALRNEQQHNIMLEESNERHMAAREKELESAAAARTNLRHADKQIASLSQQVEDLLDELEVLYDLWHPPTVKEAYEYALRKHNDDYWPVEPVKEERAIDPNGDPIPSLNPILGEQPPLDRVQVGSFDEYEDILPYKHAGPGL